MRLRSSLLNEWDFLQVPPKHVRILINISNFMYLTGINEPDVCLSLGQSKFELFMHETDPFKTIWDGPRIGLKSAVDKYGADEAREIKELPQYLKSLLKSKNLKMFTNLPFGRYTDDSPIEKFNINIHSESATHPHYDASITKFAAGGDDSIFAKNSSMLISAPLIENVDILLDKMRIIKRFFWNDYLILVKMN